MRRMIGSKPYVTHEAGLFPSEIYPHEISRAPHSMMRGMTSIEARLFLREAFPSVDTWLCWDPDTAILATFVRHDAQEGQSGSGIGNGYLPHILRFRIGMYRGRCVTLPITGREPLK